MPGIVHYHFLSFSLNFKCHR